MNKPIVSIATYTLPGDERCPSCGAEAPEVYHLHGECENCIDELACRLCASPPALLLIAEALFAEWQRDRRSGQIVERESWDESEQSEEEGDAAR